MPPEQLASYNNLKKLLTDIPNIDANLVATLVVSNFELKQFKTAPNKDIDEVSTEETIIEVSEDDALTDQEQDQIHKSKQVKEAKKKLKQMKQDAYEDALRDQYGMGESEAAETSENEGFFKENLNQIETYDRMKSEQLMEDKHGKMLSGQGGFTRSSE